MSNKYKIIAVFMIFIISAFGALNLYNNLNLGGWTIVGSHSAKVNKEFKYVDTIEVLIPQKENLNFVEGVINKFPLTSINPPIYRNKEALLTYKGVFKNQNTSLKIDNALHTALKGKAELSGVPVLESDALSQISKDTVIPGALAIILVAIFAIFIMGSISAAVISLSTGIMGIIFALGFLEIMSLFGLQISNLVISIVAVMALALGFDHPLILISRFRETNDMKNTTRKYFRKVVVFSLGTLAIITIPPIIEEKQLIIQSVVLAVLGSTIGVLAVLYLWTIPLMEILENRIKVKRFSFSKKFEVKSKSLKFTIPAIIVIILPAIYLIRNLSLEIPLANKSEDPVKDIALARNIITLFGKSVSLYTISLTHLSLKEEMIAIKDFHAKIVGQGMALIASNIQPLKQGGLIREIQSKLPGAYIGGAGSVVSTFDQVVIHSYEYIGLVAILFFILIFIYIKNFLNVNVVKSIQVSFLLVVMSSIIIAGALGLSDILSRLAGYTVYNVVDPFIAIIIAIGLTIDYTVMTIYSLKEYGYDKGLKYSSPVIRGAAFVMGLVFFAFSISSNNPAIWQLTLPLFFVVIIDAFWLRPYILVPVIKKIRTFN